MKSRIPESEKAKLNGNFELSSYDLNKQLIRGLGPISDDDFQLYKDEVYKYIDETHKENKYFMLLCKELSYYTVFTHGNLDCGEELGEALIDVVNHLGILFTYHIDELNGGFEIWIQPPQEEEVYCYIFFPYDDGVVEAR